jgi:hypothetical protein
MKELCLLNGEGSKYVRLLVSLKFISPYLNLSRSGLKVNRNYAASRFRSPPIQTLGPVTGLTKRGCGHSIK